MTCWTAAATSGNRPTVAAGAVTGVSGTPNTQTLNDGEYLTFDVAQIGSTVAGADLTIQVAFV